MTSLHNRLGTTTSPYLLHHAQNPVHWQPWDAQALAAAQSLQRPIFLSIGYSACHWCHVMEVESFANAAIAEWLNAHYVCIKVDRETRPDLDSLYMAATTALNHGHGGWPMSVFLTPDQQPFFAGTYFPPEDQGGRPGFRRVVQHLAQAWQNDRQSLIDSAAALTQALRQSLQREAGGAPGADSGTGAANCGPCTQRFAEPAAQQALSQWQAQFDPRHGGFGGAPKFPKASTLELLLAMGLSGTGAAAASCHSMVRLTLQQMAAGGLYDQVGGGFARYSTDAQWHVPHFEKMLYDNAALGRLYAQAAVAYADPLLQQVACGTLDAVLRDFTAPQGGFYCATDADSEGVEGKYFCWQYAEAAAVVGDKTPLQRLALAYLDITETGNWEGSNIVRTPVDALALAQQHCVPQADLLQAVERAKALLLAARKWRQAPALDDKVVTCYNGMMISAMAQAARLLDRADYLAAAEAASEFVLTHLVDPQGRLLRTYRSGQAELRAYLEDYAALCEGLIDLYEASGRPSHLREAERLMEACLQHYFDATDGIFYSTAHDHEPLLLRLHDGHDGAVANAHATATLCLGRLAVHLQRPIWQAVAERAAGAYQASLQRAPHAYAKLLFAQAFLRGPSEEMTLCGERTEAAYASLWRAINKTYRPFAVLSRGQQKEASAGEGGTPETASASVIVCRNRTCSAPMQDPAAVRAYLTSAG
jgi:uncharacterized protein YyaL (SSP411 family)